MVGEEATQVKSCDLLLVALLCGIAWLPVTFVREGYTWDDWVLATLSPDGRRAQSRELGHLFPFTSEVFTAAGSIGVRLGTLVAVVTTGLAVVRVVRRFGVLRRSEIVLVALVAAVNPFDTSKSLLTTANYTWSLAFFFVGWVLLVSRRWWVFALPVLFISFDTSSLLFFAVLPLVDLMFFGRTWRHPAVRFRIAGLSTTVVAFAVLRFFIRSPEGSYEGYNSLGLFGLLFTLASFGAIGLLALGLFRGRSVMTTLAGGGSLLAASGVLIVMVGLIPYLAVRKFPPYLTAETRHYLLIGLGIGITAVGISRGAAFGVGAHRVRTIVLRGMALLSLLFVWFNGFLSLQYWQFVDEVSGEIGSVDIPEGSLVLVSYEETPAVGLTRRIGPNYLDTWYVWTGIVDLDRSRGILSIVDDDYQKYLAGRLGSSYGDGRVLWGVKGFEPSSTAIHLEIDSVDGFLGFFATYEVSVSEIEVDVPLG